MKAFTFLLLVLATSITADVAIAQEVRSVTVTKGADGKPVVVESRSAPAANPGVKATAPPVGNSAAKKTEGDKDGKDKAKAGDTAPKVIKRPTSSDEPTQPIGTEAVISNGKVTFDLKGQPWDQVLQWLADTSELSLD